MRRSVVTLALLAALASACTSGTPAEPPVTATAEVRVDGLTGPQPITHGNDPLPPKPQALLEAVAPEVAWPCEGTGADGRRVQLVYAHGPGASLTASLRQTFEGIARRIEGTFLTSARKTGGERLVRFVTDAGCSLSIIDLPVSANALASFDVMVNELRVGGLNRQDRIYHAWTEASAYCGIGTVYGDDQPSATANTNNLVVQYSRSDRQCWDYAEAHEITHNLGGVQNSAPNATGGLHCRDEADLMCYPDGGPSGQMISPYPCGDLAGEALLDCRNDDYFAATPPAGGYLSTHWNTADNAALSRSAGPTTSTTVPPQPTTTTTTTLPPTTSTTIGSARTTTVLAVPSTIRSGVAFTALATVTGSCSPSGAVSFYVSGKLLSRQVLVEGAASVTLTITGGAARPTVRAEYAGSSACAASSDTARPRLR